MYKKINMIIVVSVVSHEKKMNKMNMTMCTIYNFTCVHIVCTD